MLARLLVLTALVASVAGHGGFFGPGHFGGGSEERLAYPLDSTSGGPDKTFFRGLSPVRCASRGRTDPSRRRTPKARRRSSRPAARRRSPSAAISSRSSRVRRSLTALADLADKSKFCPGDLGSLHSANGKRSGCALAISYKPFDQINGPDDMKVFSVLADCPHVRRELRTRGLTGQVDSAHVFEIPANLPATPKGKPATCVVRFMTCADVGLLPLVVGA